MKSRRRANRRAANSNVHFGISNREIATVATLAIVAGLGYVMWRGRDQIGPMLARLPDRFNELPQLPAPDDVRDSVTASWRAALKRLPKLDPDKLRDLSRGVDALKQLIVRA